VENQNPERTQRLPQQGKGQSKDTLASVFAGALGERIVLREMPQPSGSISPATLAENRIFA
jgi:hypothetical protein